MSDWPGQQRLAALVEFSTDAIVLVDADGIIRWGSPSTRDVLGYGPEGLVGTRVRDLVSPGDLAPWREMVEQLFEQPGIPRSGTFRCRHLDGSHRWLSGVARNLLAEPQVGSIAVYFRDVTSAREVEDAFRLTEARYRQLFEDATDVIFEADHEGYFRLVNPATLQLFGFTEAEVIGRRFTEFVRPDFRRQLFEHYKRQTDAGEPTSYVEFPALPRDGRELWLGQNAWMTRDAQGRFSGMRAVARDITERRRTEQALREAEAKYRSLVEQSLVGVYIVHGERLVYSNPKGAEITGYTLAELAAIDGIFDNVVPADRSYVRERLETITAEGVTHVHFVARVVRKGGAIATVEAYCTPTEYGGEPAILATVVDISERVQLEDQLRQAQKMEAIGRLAGGIAHDFNNLLTAIRGNAELLFQRLRTDPARASEIEEILHAADRAASLTRQLLAFSRRQDVTAVNLNLNDVVENVGRMARRLIGPAVRLELQADPAVRVIHADPAQIEQLLLNLVVNARDALPSGGKVRITTSNRRIVEGSPEASRSGLEPADYVLLEVSDNGEGMDQATQARIFEPFFTTKEPGRGTGLGLSMVYGIVRQMGGAVTVESARDAGATFRVYLPAAAHPEVAVVEPVSNGEA